MMEKRNVIEAARTPDVEKQAAMDAEEAAYVDQVRTFCRQTLRHLEEVPFRAAEDEEATPS